jgi:ArsR family transcriptional regulator
MDLTLERELNQLHADFCSGLADAKRLLLLYTLAEGPKYVNDLAEILSMSQPAVSRHLKILRDRGMVVARRTGTQVEYRLSDPRLIEALDLLRAAMRDVLTHRAEVLEALED